MAAKKKKEPKKRSANTDKRPDSLASSLMRGLNGILTLIVIVVAAGLLANLIIYREPLPPKKKIPESKPHIIKYKKPQRVDKVTPRITKKPQDKKPSLTKETQPDEKNPRIAIIIDDIGNDYRIAEKFLDLDIDITLSILPHSPQGKKIARSANKRGCDVMLHLPMEPNEYPDVQPGPGALLSSMSPDQLLKQLNIDIDSVPFLVGVNNHMGSRMTAQIRHMNLIFKVLKDRNLFFVDSRTTVETKCRQAARQYQVPFAERNVFIDHNQSRDFIEQQLDRLKKIAERKGEAVGIGHPHQITYEMLRKSLRYLKKNAKFVRVSKLVALLT